MPYDLVFPSLGIYSKETCTYMYHKEYTRMFIGVLFVIAQN